MPLRFTSLARLLLGYFIIGWSADPSEQNSDIEGKASTAPDSASLKNEETMEVGDSRLESRPVMVWDSSRRPRNSYPQFPFNDVPTVWVEDKENPVTGLWDFRGSDHKITIGHLPGRDGIWIGHAYEPDQAER